LTVLRSSSERSIACLSASAITGASPVFGAVVAGTAARIATSLLRSRGGLYTHGLAPSIDASCPHRCPDVRLAYDRRRREMKAPSNCNGLPTISITLDRHGRLALVSAA
jgi:hypothetical protein